MSRKKRIAILSSGTIAPGINAAIRAAVRTVYRNGDVIIAIENGFDGFFDLDLISLPHWSFFQGLLYRGGSILGLPRHGDPFNYPVIRGSEINYIDKSSKVLSVIGDFKIDTVILIGGMKDIEIASKLAKSNVRFILIPNFICNDLSISDITFGFKTAVQTASNYLDRLHSTAESHNRVFIVEVIGADSGWMALESGIAGGADVILIPEIQFKLSSIVDTINERISKLAPFSLIVVAEGVKPADDEPCPMTDSIISHIGPCLQEAIDQDIRSLSLSLIQRGGSPIAYDRVLASNYGTAAGELAISDDNNSQVITFSPDLVTHDLSDLHSEIRTVAKDDRILQIVHNLNISLGD